MTTDGTGSSAGNSVSNGALRTRWDAAVMGTYGTPPIALVRGEGATVWDADGREYLDFLSGIAVNLLGHAHPRVVEAVTQQIATLGHISNLYISPPAVILAERLLGLFGRGGRVFFCNSGAEANEAAFKIARKTGRPEVVAAEESFHGRTMGALALTGQPSKRAPFEPLPGGVRFVPYGDAAALEAAVGEQTAAVFLEPIQGEGGVVPPPPGYLAAAREITTRRGALLVIDEVQCGMGRTGAWFAHQASDVAPDVVTLAKGLGGGLPLGACVTFGAATTLLAKGEHATTFGGNPVSCAAANAVLDVLAEEDLPGRAKTLGERLRSGIQELADPLVAEVRGAGLLLGIRLTRPVAADVEAAARDAGLLVNTVRPDVVRLAPPLVISDDAVDRFLAAFPGALEAAR
ncbi:MAG: acetylornithine transaminase [Streptosporangiales bacterium]|nr:acetylornithine transaminase [Streptosporangiales bacterium]